MAEVKTVKIDNVELDLAVFDRMVERCNVIGCDVNDFIEQALTYAMDNEDLGEEENNEDR